MFILLDLFHHSSPYVNRQNNLLRLLRFDATQITATTVRSIELAVILCRLRNPESVEIVSSGHGFDSDDAVEIAAALRYDCSPELLASLFTS